MKFSSQIDIERLYVQYWKKRRMFRKLALVMLWFFTVPLILVSSFFLIRHQASNNQSVNVVDNINIPPEVKLETKNGFEGQVMGLEITDLRPYLVENFLKGTPLAPHSKLIVEVSDQYGIDYRLIPAIAMKEAGGGATAREGSYNAWGFGNGRVDFGSWEQAIASVAKTLKRNYIDRGLVTPEQIMAVYAPPQLLTGGKWAEDINFFFQKLESL